MSIVLPALAVAFAAFCIWLALRIVNRRERWAKWTLAVVVGLPIEAYVGSYYAAVRPEAIGFGVVVPVYVWTSLEERSCTYNPGQRPRWKRQCEEIFEPLTRIDPRLRPSVFNP